MKKIFLTQGQTTIVDDADYEWLNQWSWVASYAPEMDTYYATRQEYLGNYTQRTIKMHREILGLKFGDKRQVDHIHHNTLDNRRSELRIVSNRENKSNLKRKDLCLSKFTGVTMIKERNKRWRARIRIGKQSKHLGYFYTEEDASNAYQKALKGLSA